MINGLAVITYILRDLILFSIISLHITIIAFICIISDYSSKEEVYEVTHIPNV